MAPFSLYLKYEAYEGMAEEVMADLADAMKVRHDLCALAIFRRIGRVASARRFSSSRSPRLTGRLR